MAKKALIVYASLTGNTEQVAMRFKQTFNKYGWECDTFKATKTTDKNNLPYHFFEDDYDLFCVGAPIWSGIPPLYLYDDRLGCLQHILSPRVQGKDAHGYPRMTRAPESGWRNKKGIVFVTYAGSGLGPLEAMPALGLLEHEGMERWRIKCIGKFACPGKLWRENDVRPVQAVFLRLYGIDNWQVGDGVEALGRYKENPDAPEYAGLSKEDRAVLDKAAKDTENFKSTLGEGGGSGTRGWHHDLERRPTERDLLKAEIFLSEIIEDIYGYDIEMYPYSQYLCIS